jgi:hypothetical protein
MVESLVFLGVGKVLLKMVYGKIAEQVQNNSHLIP